MRFRGLALAMAFVVPFVLAPSGVDAQTIGTTITTKKLVRGTPPGGSTHRKKGRDPIVRNEAIETGDDSTGQFEFSDGTNLAVGPNARIVLNSAVFSGPERHRLTRGTLRFATDLAAPAQALVVDTPVASIGVRGTIFDAHVDEDGSTLVLLVRGGPVDVCSGGSCTAITTTCDAVSVGVGGGRSGPAPIGSFGSLRALGADFPFASGAQRARPQFTRGAARCGLLATIFRPPNDEDRRSQEEPDESPVDDAPAPPSYSPPSPVTPTPPTAPPSTPTTPGPPNPDPNNT